MQKSKFDIIDEMTLFMSNSLSENKLTIKEIIEKIRLYEDEIIEKTQTKEDFKQVLNHLTLRILQEINMSRS